MLEELELRKIGDRILIKCPKCGLASEVTTSQLAGQESIRCPMVVCDFCVTLDLRNLKTRATP